MNAVHFNQKGELVRDDEVTEEIEEGEEKEKPLMPDDLKTFSSSEIPYSLPLEQLLFSWV